MYRKHFGLARHPFARDLAPEDLFSSSAATELEVRLKHLLDLRGIGLVTGEPGGGKTTICRKVAASLHSGLYRVLYVPLSTGNVTDMYKSIAWELGLPTERSRAALYRVIRAEVNRRTSLTVAYVDVLSGRWIIKTSSGKTSRTANRRKWMEEKQGDPSAPLRDSAEP